MIQTFTVPCDGHDFEVEIPLEDLRELRRRGTRSIHNALCPTCARRVKLSVSALLDAVDHAEREVLPVALEESKVERIENGKPVERVEGLAKRVIEKVAAKKLSIPTGAAPTSDPSASSLPESTRPARPAATLAPVTPDTENVSTCGEHAPQ